ncbi:MAG: STT3 domain-containing protein [Promethearchaeota archaeon]
MSKVVSSLKNTKDRIHANVSFKSYNILFFIALSMIVILAIVVRLSPLLRGGQLIKAFDPWIQWYTSEYLDTHSLYEFFTWHDFKSWYPDGFDRFGYRPGLLFTVVIIHKIFNFIGIPLSLYDICYFFPAFMGGISVLAMYFLGKEILDRRCGLLAAFFMAFSVGYMSRTMAGFFDNETIGVFAAIMCLLFFIKTLKSGKVTHSLIGGVFLGYLCLTWGGYTYILLILPVIVAVFILAKKYNENVLIAYAGVQGMGILIFSLYTRFKYGDLISDIEIGGVFLFTILLIIFHVIYSKKKDYPNFYRNLINLLKWGVVPIILIFAMIIWIAPGLIPLGLSSRFTSIISPLLRNQISLVASVAEHVPSPWSSFYNNTLVPLMLIPLGIYFCFKRGNMKDIVLIIFVLTLFYFTGSMTRIILIFAPAASLVAAYGLSSVLNTYGSFIGERRSGVSRKRRRQVKNTITNSEVFAVYLIVGIVCIAQVVHAVDASVDQLSYGSIVTGQVLHDWEESLTWMKNNLEGTDVVVSWWDYGYWLTPIGNVTTVNDNATANSTRIGMTGMAFMQTDEIYAAKVLKRLKADYILVYFTYLYSGLGGDEGKWQWMLRICNDHYERYKALGMEEDNWADGAVFDESEYTDERGVKGQKWFDTQLVKLMFWGEPTTASDNSNQLVKYYNERISSWTTLQDTTWKEEIDNRYPNGNVDSNVFIYQHFSSAHLVKLYKIDYTVLESSFSINNAKVYDSGYGTFELKNTGTKDLTITNVSINGIDYDFKMGKGVQANQLSAGDDDLVWVDIDPNIYNVNNVVKITVTAEADGLQKKYTFTESTSNFLVSKGVQDSIKINEAKSKVIQRTEDQVDVYLEVENTGSITTFIDDIYVNTEDNPIDGFPTTYINGSSILEPGEKAFLKISNVDSDMADFYPLKEKHNLIGVITPNGFKDEVLFSSSYEGYNLTVYDNSRIISPEVSISTDSRYRYHVPVNLSETHAYSYDNNTTQVYVKVKNTGDFPVTISSVYFSTSDTWTQVNPGDFNFLSGTTVLGKGDEDILNISLDELNPAYYDIRVNDELGIKITAEGSVSNDTCSNVFYVHTLNESSDIQIIETINSIDTEVDGRTVSYVMANETGTLLIKNTGDQPISLDYLNVATVSNNVNLDFQNTTEVLFISGNDTLGIQECAFVSLNLTALEINITDDIYVDIYTSEPSANIYNYNFKAVDNPPVGPTYYNISIDETNTQRVSGNVEIAVDNLGLLNITINSVFINDTYIPLINFTNTNFEIGAGLSFTLIIEEAILSNFIGGSGDYIDILVRTKEGAEDESINVDIS